MKNLMSNSEKRTYDCITYLFEKHGFKQINIIDLLSIIYKAHKYCIFEAGFPLIQNGGVVCHDSGLVNKEVLDILCQDSDYFYRIKNDIFYAKSTDKGRLTKFIIIALDVAYESYFLNQDQSTRNYKEYKDHYLFNKNIEINLTDLLKSYNIDEERRNNIIDLVENSKNIEQFFVEIENIEKEMP